MSTPLVNLSHAAAQERGIGPGAFRRWMLEISGAAPDIVSLRALEDEAHTQTGIAGGAFRRWMDAIAGAVTGSELATPGKLRALALEAIRYARVTGNATFQRWMFRLNARAVPIVPPPTPPEAFHAEGVRGFSATSSINGSNAALEGPPFGPGRTIVFTWDQFGLVAGALDNVLWGNYRGGFGAGVGWLIDCQSTGAVFLICRPLGATVLTPAVFAYGGQLHTMAIAWSADGLTLRVSLDGGAVTVIAAPTYNAPDAICTNTIGGGGAYSGGGLPSAYTTIACREYDRVLSDAELREHTNAVNGGPGVNRYELPDASGDASLSFDWDVETDLPIVPGAGQTIAAPSRGSSPVAFSAVSGVSPLIAVDCSYWRYAVDTTNPADSVVQIPGPPILHSPFARFLFTTDATKIVLEAFRTMSVAIYGDMGLRRNGVYQDAPVEQAQIPGVVQLQLAGGAGQSIQVIEGMQIEATSPVPPPEGTVLYRGISVNAGALLVQDTPTPWPAQRIVFYGDSITVGGNVNIGGGVCPRDAYPMVVREAFAGVAGGGGVSVEAFGYRSLWDDARTAPLRAIFVARLVQLLKQFEGGNRYLWLAIGTNDYAYPFGNGRWSAADFGTAYGLVLDEVHAAVPGVLIYAQSPLQRIAPASEAANFFGDTLPDYRTVISNLCAARPGWTIYVEGGAQAIVPDAELDPADGIHEQLSGAATHAAFVQATIGF